MGMGYDADYVRNKSPEEIAREMTDISNRRIQASNRALKLQQALENFLDITESSADLPNRDPHYGQLVEDLGSKIGYGAMMASAQASWRELLERKGPCGGGEHVAGPSYSVLLSARKQAKEALQ